MLDFYLFISKKATENKKNKIFSAIRTLAYTNIYSTVLCVLILSQLKRTERTCKRDSVQTKQTEFP